MKQIVAIVKPFLAERVISVLPPATLELLQVREVKGFGRQKSYLDQYSESEFSEAFLPKVEISMWTEDDQYEDIVQQLVSVARTGRLGDGKIFIVSGDMVALEDDV